MNYNLSFYNPYSHHPRKRQKLFFRKFINSSDLVFDIGANVGDRVDVFSEFGVRIVAVEPQTYCTEVITKRFGDLQTLYVENIGLSDQDGELTLHISDVDNRLSTFSNEQMSESFFSNSKVWNRDVTIKVKTLDYLVEKYGVPDFCKIDVEGFEKKVLLGLSTPIPCLSFEFSSKRMIDIEDCVSILLKLSNRYKFNICFGEPYQLESEEWMVEKELIKRVLERDAIEITHAWGDIYAKLV
jgi:FkbM family methyltransferase